MNSYQMQIQHLESTPNRLSAQFVIMREHAKPRQNADRQAIVQLLLSL